MRPASVFHLFECQTPVNKREKEKEESVRTFLVLRRKTRRDHKHERTLQIQIYMIF